MGLFESPLVAFFHKFCLIYQNIYIWHLRQWFILLRGGGVNQRQNTVKASLSSTPHNFKNFPWRYSCMNVRPTFDKSLFSSFFSSTCWFKGICRKSSSQQMKLTVHPIQTGSGERPYDPFNAKVSSSWRSARQVWAVIKHSRALQPKRDPTGVIPLASASPRAMFALTTELPFRMTHWSSGKDWSVRGKVWKLGCVTPLSRAHAPRAAGNATGVQCKHRSLLSHVRRGALRKQLRRYKRGVQVIHLSHTICCLPI